MNGFNDMRDLFPVTKTLTVGLIPHEKTRDAINAGALIQHDEEIAAKYPGVKHALDTFHRDNLTLIFENEDFKNREAADLWAQTIQFYRHRNDKDGKEDENGKRPAARAWDAAYKKITGKILAAMAASEHYKKCTAPSPKIILGILKDRNKNNEYSEAIEAYYNRASTLSTYQANRKMLYTSTKKNTPAYRIVNDNMPRFARNIELWDNIRLKWEPAQKTLDHILERLDCKEVPTDAFFREGGYGHFLTQKGISVYNALINGWTERDEATGTVYKVKGLTDYLREAMQKDKSLKLKLPVKLLRQILAERETASYVPPRFYSDDQVWAGVEMFFDTMERSGAAKAAEDILVRLKDGYYNDSEIYLTEKQRSFLGNKMYDSWRAAGWALILLAEERYAKKSERKAFLDRKLYTLADMDEAFRLYAEKNGLEYPGSIATVLLKLFREAAAKIGPAYRNAMDVKRSGCSLDGDKRRNKELSRALTDAKEGHDILCKVRQYESGADEMFVGDLDEVFEAWGGIVPLFNATRAWCTKKPYSNDKTRLMLYNNSFIKGWSWGKNGTKIDQYGGIFAWIDGQLHLVVSNAGKGKREKYKITKLETGEGGVTLVVTDKAKFRTGATNSYYTWADADPEVVQGLREKRYRTDMAFTWRAIAEMQRMIAEHPSYNKYHIPHQEPKLFRDWNEFIDFCQDRGYMMGTKEVSRRQVEGLVESGDLLLFRVFTRGLKRLENGGTTNLLQNVHLLDALNGENDTELLADAEMYYRPISYKNATVHKKGSFLVNKRANDEARTPVPEKVWKQAYDYYNGRLDREKLSPETVEWISSGRLVVKKAAFEITKKKCYTEERFTLHVKVKLQSSLDEVKNIRGLVNDRVKEWLDRNPGYNVLGINRGENNLLYAVVVGPDCRIIEQKAINVLDGMDYRTRIGDRVENMKQQRDDWEEMDTITPIQEGFVSGAIREVIGMALRHDAVIAIEDLDFDFLKSRARLGETIYRKFQAMLLEKLHYLIPDKSRPHDVLQLASGKKEGFGTGRRCNGIVFAISPWQTSGTDPKTGFVNLLPVSQAATAEKKRELFRLMKAVTRGKDGVWRFTFDYRDYAASKEFNMRFTGLRTLWTVTSAGERLGTEMQRPVKKDGKPDEKARPVKVNVTYDPSAMFDEAVEFKFDGDLRERLAGLTGSSLEKAFDALIVMMRCRNCDIRATTDYFLSPVEGGFDSRLAREDEPATTDAVTAYNLARKVRMLIDGKAPKTKKENGTEVDGNSIDAETWLRCVQGGK